MKRPAFIEKHLLNAPFTKLSRNTYPQRCCSQNFWRYFPRHPRIDTKEHAQNITWSSPKNEILKITAHEEIDTEWTTLNIPMTSSRLKKNSTVGIAVHATSSRPILLKIALRHGNEDSFTDYTFKEPLYILPSGSRDFSALTLEAGASTWREIVLFLPTKIKFHIIIHSFKAFII